MVAMILQHELWDGTESRAWFLVLYQRVLVVSAASLWSPRPGIICPVGLGTGLKGSIVLWLVMMSNSSDNVVWV